MSSDYNAVISDEKAFSCTGVSYVSSNREWLPQYKSVRDLNSVGTYGRG